MTKKKRTKKRKVVLKTPAECKPPTNTILLYGTPDLHHTIYELALTAPDPFVISFGNISHSEDEKLQDAKIYRCNSWGYVSAALESIDEQALNTSTVILNNLTAAYDAVLRRILTQNDLIYPNSKDVWLEAVYRVKSLVFHLNKLKKNVILLVGSKEIYIEDEVNNGLIIRPAISDGLFASFTTIVDATLFVHKEGKTKDLIVSGESPVNNWYIASCRSPTLKSKLSTDFSSFLS